MSAAESSQVGGDASPRVWPAALMQAALLLALLAGAVYTRFSRLGSEAIWLDESITFNRATLPVPELVADAIARHHNPSYFLLMHYWLLLGDDEFMLRVPSAIFGTLAALAAAGLGWVVGGFRVALLSGVLFALSPALLRYSQEARMYAPYVLFTTLALSGLLWLVRHRTAAAVPVFGRARARELGTSPAGAAEARRARYAWAVFTLATAAVLYVHNTAVLFWASCWLVAAIMGMVSDARRSFARNWLFCNGFILICWAPWLSTLVTQAKEVSEHFWVKFPDLDTVAKTLQDLYLFGHKPLLPGAIVAGAALLGLWALRKDKPLAAALIVLSIATPVMVLIISLHRPIWMLRIMLWATVPFFVLAAQGIAALRSRIAIAVVALVVIVSGVRALDEEYYHVQRKPRWHDALTFLIAQNTITGPTLLIGDREERPVYYYTHRQVQPYAFSGIACTPEQLDEQLSGRNTVWMLSANAKQNANAILRMMKTRGRLQQHRRFGHGLEIFQYLVFNARQTRGTT